MRSGRASRTPPRIPDSGARGERPPPPPPRRGATAHVSPPRPVEPFPRARGSGTSWSKAREGIWADPLPPPHARAVRLEGERRPPPPLSSRPSLPPAPSGNCPSPCGSDLGTWAGPRTGPPPSAPLPPFRILRPQTKFRDPNPAPARVAGGVPGRPGAGGSTCLLPHPGRGTGVLSGLHRVTPGLGTPLGSLTPCFFCPRGSSRA